MEEPHENGALNDGIQLSERPVTRQIKPSILLSSRASDTTCATMQSSSAHNAVARGQTRRQILQDSRALLGTVEKHSIS